MASVAPNFPRTDASGSVSLSANTPSICFFAPAGLVNGPRILKIVLMAISRLGPIANFMAGWNRGANKNPKLVSKRHCSTFSGERSIFIPSASRTSALPDWLDTERLPCFATGMPEEATTIAVVVEILNVPDISPPVPQVSIPLQVRQSLLPFLSLFSQPQLFPLQSLL